MRSFPGFVVFFRSLSSTIASTGVPSLAMPPKKAARWSIKEGFRATLPKDVARLSPATLTPHQLLSAYGLAPPSSTSPPQLRTCSNRWTLDDSQELQTRIIETITLESDDDSDPIASPSPLKAKKPAAKGKGKGKAKESSTTLCSAEKCANNPNCLNWLGQAKWENAGELFRLLSARSPLRFDRV